MQAVASKVAEKGNGERLKNIKCFDDMRGSASGGTIATLFESLQGRAQYKAVACDGFDPLLREKSPGSGASDCKTKADLQAFIGYSKLAGSWVGPFVMASVMANCVRRSNAILGYGPKLSYYEAARYPSFAAGFVSVFTLIIFGTCLACPPLTWILRTCVLPKPGEGPNEATMDAGFLRVTAVGEGVSGTKAKCSFYFPNDPGYRDTARMLVESGLSLALQADEITCGGGVYTPAACQGAVLRRRLEATGSSFQWLPVEDMSSA